MPVNNYVEDTVEEEIKIAIKDMINKYHIQDRIGLDELYDILNDLVYTCIDLYEEDYD